MQLRWIFSTNPSILANTDAVNLHVRGSNEKYFQNEIY